MSFLKAMFCTWRWRISVHCAVHLVWRSCHLGSRAIVFAFYLFMFSFTGADFIVSPLIEQRTWSSFLMSIYWFLHLRCEFSRVALSLSLAFFRSSSGLVGVRELVVERIACVMPATKEEGSDELFWPNFPIMWKVSSRFFIAGYFTYGFCADAIHFGTWVEYFLSGDRAQFVSKCIAVFFGRLLCNTEVACLLFKFIFVLLHNYTETFFRFAALSFLWIYVCIRAWSSGNAASGGLKLLMFQSFGNRCCTVHLDNMC